MKALAAGLVIAAALAGCNKGGGTTGSTSGASSSAPSTTSPAIDTLLAGVPGNAFALGFVDMETPPWSMVTGGYGMFPLTDATRKTLDAELHAYMDKYIGVDVSKLQYAVGFVSGPPPGGALLVKALSGTPKLPGSSDYEGAKVWQVDQDKHIVVALKGDIAMLGTEAAVHDAIDTLAQKKKSVITENKELVEWLHKETKGAAIGFAAFPPKGLPLPPQVAGLQRVAASVGRTGVRAAIEGDEAAISRLETIENAAFAKMLEEVDRAHAAAIAGDIPPPNGMMAIIGAAYAKDYAAKLKPKREGNRLSSALVFEPTAGSDVMMMTSVVGILAAVAVPAFMDYMKKSKKTESSLELNRIAKNLKVYYVTNAAFPEGDTTLSPAESCCAGPNHKCFDPSTWQQKAWQDLDFQIDEPHLFQYRYHSDGKTAVAEAVGDLDCDGVSITYRLDATADAGNPTITITEPPPNSD
ncbi:MAG TPA: hypothetical protein VGM90_17695 [Kofleriaceae bacterium]|jgi:type II secretory pathway pseudopilin PulG